MGKGGLFEGHRETLWVIVSTKETFVSYFLVQFRIIFLFHIVISYCRVIFVCHVVLFHMSVSYSLDTCITSNKTCEG